MSVGEQIIEQGVWFAIDLGLVWVFAGVFNPDVNTGTVWFIAVLFAGLREQTLGSKITIIRHLGHKG